RAAFDQVISEVPNCQYTFDGAREQVLQDLDQCRRDGYEVVYGAHFDGIAVPIFDHTGYPVAAFGVVFSKLDSELLARVLNYAKVRATAASTELGFHLS